MDLEMFIYLFVLIFVLTIISVGGALFIILDIYLIQKLSEKIDIEISLINILTLPSALVVLGTLGKRQAWFKPQKQPIENWPTERVHIE